MYDERNETMLNKYSDYINTRDKYNYYIDDDINLYNLRTKLIMRVNLKVTMNIIMELRSQ